MTGHQVVSLAEREGRIDHVEVLDGEGRLARVRGHAYVLALGASSVPHAQALDIDMQLRFVREYIVTIPVKDPARAPRTALRDRQGRLRIARVETPQGDWLRVTTTVRAGADEDEEPDSDRFEAILQRIDRLLPGAADLGRAELETAVHAVSRSRLPMIGKTRLPNLFLNSAPGTPDWVHVCGAGKSIARIVSGLRPELDFAFRRP
jgi:D-amino-acid dehydrogenase